LNGVLSERDSERSARKSRKSPMFIAVRVRVVAALAAGFEDANPHWYWMT
jgi:hypothetical protein